MPSGEHGARVGGGRAVAIAVGVLAAAVALAAAALVPRADRTVLVGRPGDRSAIGGFLGPADQSGQTGRWTRGDSVIRLPPYGASADVVLRLAASPDRVTDPIEIEINGILQSRVSLGADVREFFFHVDRPQRDAQTVVRLRSATSPFGNGLARGIFVERGVLSTGGLRRLARTPAFVGISLTAIWLALLVLAGRLTSMTEAWWPRVFCAAGILTLAYVAIVSFRVEIVGHLLATALLCWAATAAVLGAGSERIARTFDVFPARREAFIFLIAASLLVCLLFPRVISRGEVLSQADIYFDYAPWRGQAPPEFQHVERPPLHDVPMLVYPFAVFTQTHWREAAFPLWTRNMSSGQPLLATYQSALFSPFTALLSVVSLPRATVVIAVARLLVGGLGMFLFLRAIRLSPWAAAFGGVTYLLNPFSVVWLEHPLAGVPPWLPWMLLGAEWVAAGRRLGVPLLAASTGLALLGGHPHTALFVATLGGAYALLRALQAPGRLRVVGLACAAMAVGWALAALQILPFLEYLSLSRAATTRTVSALNPYIAPASTLITALVPNFLGHHSWGNFSGPTNYFEQQIYPGVVTWLLAVIGCAYTARQPRTWFLVGATLVAMLVMYGAPGMHQLVSSIPLIKAASLPRIAIVALASLSVLGALGAEEVLKADRSRRSAWTLTAVSIAIAAGLSMIAVLCLNQQRPFLESRGLVEFTTRWTMLAAWLPCVACLLGMVASHLLAPARTVGCALVGLAALDLLTFGNGFHPTIPPAQVFPVVPEIRAVQQDPDLFRVLGLKEAMLPNAAMAYGLQDIRGYDGLGVARYLDLLDVALREHDFQQVADGIYSPLINLLNVKYVFATEDVRPPEGWFTRMTDSDAPLYRNTRVFPRAFVVDQYVVRTGNPARRTLRDGLVDFHRVVLLDEEPAIDDRPSPAASGADLGGAQVTQYRDDRVEIHTTATARRFLVLTDVHYPGWHVAIDGKPARLYVANFAFRAASVPAGTHTVTFTYQPASFRVGAAVSGLALVILIGAIAIGRRGPRSPTSPACSPR